MQPASSPAPSASSFRIYLVGMMGVGKSTIGRKMASILNCPFYDLDKEIEAHEGRTISGIFETEGEPYFRKTESEVLRQITGEHFVMATGGGAPCYHDNITYINSAGKSIYLRANEGLIFQRITRYPAKRPLLKGMNEAQIRDFIHQKLKEREPYYLQSDHVFDVPSVSAETIVKSIVSAD